MTNTFFTADTHFGHRGVLGMCQRPFTDIEEHDAALVAAWNAIVGPRDTVWHLGDFALGASPERCADLFRRLQGRKRLVRGDDPVEFARDPLSRQRRVDHQRQALPRAVIGHDEDAEAPPVVERVGDEVEAPALVRLLRHHRRRSRAQGSLATAALAHRQPLLSVEPEEHLVVESEALPPQRSRMSRRR